MFSMPKLFSIRPLVRLRVIAPGRVGPGIFTPSPLTDPCLTVSRHTARATP